MAEPTTLATSPMQAQHLPPELEHIVQLVDNKPEALARGDAGMHTAALAAVQLIYKISLESEKSAAAPISKLLSSLSPGDDAPTTRAQKRKRDEAPKPPPLVFRPTPRAGRLVDGLIPGLNARKLWEVMERRTGPLCGILEAVVAPEGVIEEEEEEEEEESSEVEEGEMELDSDEEGMDYTLSDEEEDDDDDDDEDQDDDDDDEEESDGEESYLGDTTMELSRAEDHLESSDDEDEEEEIGSGYLHGIDLDRAENPQKVAKRRAHPTLDDAFFSIDDFNRETEALEAQSRTSGALNEDDDDEEDEDVDLFMQVNDIEDTEEANDPKYQDFFAPPPKTKKAPKAKPSPKASSPSKPKRKVKLLVASPPKRSTKVRFNEEVKVRNVKSRRSRASLLAELVEAGEEVEGDEGEWEDEEGEGPWTSEMLDEDDDTGSDEDEDEGSGDDEETEGKKGDLFAEDESDDEDGAAMSSHQKRLAALDAEIKALEAENVAPKPWTLQGEATARSRPQNALLAADLEFEHLGKVVPVVTEEAVKKLEDRIKARIIEGRYDDVVRKREIDPKPFLPSRMFELKDTQSEKSLAQIYEDEYTAAKAGPSSAPIDDRDGKLAQEHKEIEELWDGICYKLDALSNAHFTPKQPKAQITSVSNMASASLESALPTSLSTSTLLAPEEVYAPATGDTRAKGELSPAEKRAARTKDRKKRKKQRDSLASAVDKFGANGSVSGRGAPRNVKQAKDQALKGLVKNGKGVTVVGKGQSKAAGKGKGIKETNATSRDVAPERDGKKFKL